jgi:hypothetical protein
MFVVLCDLELNTYIEEDAKPLTPADPNALTTAETEVVKKWCDGDAKTRARIESVIGDSEMVHIISTTTARQMWKQLTLIKEARGQLGILLTRCALYKMTAEEEFNLVDHIPKLQRYQEELHLMESVATDEDFAVILLESWDLYTSAYLGSKTDGLALTSYELVAILLEEVR